VFANIYK